MYSLSLQPPSESIALDIQGGVGQSVILVLCNYTANRLLVDSSQLNIN